MHKDIKYFCKTMNLDDLILTNQACHKNQQKISSHINHSSQITPLLIHFNINEVYYLIFEKGEEMIYDYLRSHRYQPLMQTKVRILQQIAMGLHAMHSQRCAHMDIKLENILRYKKKEGDLFKLIDLESSIDFSHSAGRRQHQKFIKYNASRGVYFPGSENGYIGRYLELGDGEVIIESESQEEGQNLLKNFLKNKNTYIDNLISSIDLQTKNNTDHNNINKKLAQIFAKCLRQEPSKRIDVAEILNILSQL